MLVDIEIPTPRSTAKNNGLGERACAFSPRPSISSAKAEVRRRGETGFNTGVKDTATKEDDLVAAKMSKLRKKFNEKEKNGNVPSETRPSTDPHSTKCNGIGSKESSLLELIKSKARAKASAPFEPVIVLHPSKLKKTRPSLGSVKISKKKTRQRPKLASSTHDQKSKSLRPRNQHKKSEGTKRGERHPEETVYPRSDDPRMASLSKLHEIVAHQTASHSQTLTQKTNVRSVRPPRGPKNGNVESNDTSSTPSGTVGQSRKVACGSTCTAHQSVVSSEGFEISQSMVEDMIGMQPGAGPAVARRIRVSPRLRRMPTWLKRSRKGTGSRATKVEKKIQELRQLMKKPAKTCGTHMTPRTKSARVDKKLHELKEMLRKKALRREDRGKVAHGRAYPVKLIPVTDNAEIEMVIEKSLVPNLPVAVVQRLSKTDKTVLKQNARSPSFSGEEHIPEQDIAEKTKSATKTVEGSCPAAPGSKTASSVEAQPATVREEGEKSLSNINGERQLLSTPTTLSEKHDDSVISFHSQKHETRSHSSKNFFKRITNLRIDTSESREPPSVVASNSPRKSLTRFLRSPRVLPEDDEASDDNLSFVVEELLHRSFSFDAVSGSSKYDSSSSDSGDSDSVSDNDTSSSPGSSFGISNTSSSVMDIEIVSTTEDGTLHSDLSSFSESTDGSYSEESDNSGSNFDSFSDSSGYYSYDDEGDETDIAADYLIEIAQELGIQPGQLIDKLEAGQDIEGLLLLNRELKQKM